MLIFIVLIAIIGRRMDQLRAIKYFVKVVETGSFTKAAAVFAVPTSSLSRRVSDLEKSLGASLLKRSTRVVNLTEIGRQYFNDVKDLLFQLEQTDEAVRSYQATPMGKLRISSMVGFGERLLVPLLEEFSEMYPKIILDVSLSDELSTLARDEVDIAIRGGYAPDERVLAIKLMENHFIPVASKSYLEKMGVPKSVKDLKQHKGLFFKSPNGPIPWIGEVEGQLQDVSGEPLLITNKGSWLVEKAINGQGILMLPRWVLKPYIDSGTLQELPISSSLHKSRDPSFGVFLLYQKQRYTVPKVKAAVDFLVARIKGRY